ncbi:acyl-[acyl-carrier-protein] thioesterase [Lawsonibacter sp.]|uniref:acyl-[acyl-carrier-protein] thioesterase n=1 Tax=Lawsonibacter sp. TaxID=2185275 RepID=UPI002582B64C|nr:acyl-ACP thioesterase domain-containing protein [Lawsonibacter sp.]MCI6398849.1 thioesterase [Lawsonibacter sp.]MDY2977718.1 thioesterase [Oscillospiraceae bacterium]
MTVYEREYRVDSRETDPWYNCRPSGVLGFLQEAATAAACALHASRDEMLDKYNAFWMLARVWYRLDEPLKWGDRLRIRTWHRGGRGASSYRDFDLFVNDAPVGEAVSLWVLANAQTHKLVRMAGIEEFQGTDGGALCKTRLLNKVRMPPDMTCAGTRSFRYSDLDVNGHVNNVRYADIVCDALHLERMGAERFVSSLQVGYQAECRVGETVDLTTGSDGGAQYVHGADGAGKTRFDAMLTLSDLAGKAP